MWARLRGIVSTDGTPAEQLDRRSARAADHGRPGTRQPRHRRRNRTTGLKARSIWPRRSPRPRLRRVRQVANSAQHRHGSRGNGTAAAKRAIAWSPTISASSKTFLRLFVDHGCDVTVVPAKTSAEDVLALKPRRRFPVERSGRSRADHLRHREYSQTPGPRADFRHLPGASALRPGSRRQDLQAEIRPSRLESSGEKSAARKKSKSPRRITASASIRIRCRRATWKSRTSI